MISGETLYQQTAAQGINHAELTTLEAAQKVMENTPAGYKTMVYIRHGKHYICHIPEDRYHHLKAIQRNYLEIPLGA